MRVRLRVRGCSRAADLKTKGIRRLKHLLRIIITLLLTLAPALAVRAQDEKNVTAVPLSKVPYRVGERLTYNVSFANFPTAAHIELWIAGHGVYFNRPGIHLRAHIETVGVVDAALFSINNDYLAYINPETGQPFQTQQLRREAGRTSDIAREYDKPAGTEAIPGKLRTGGLPGTYDIASALYRLRALPLTEGARYGFLMNINDVLYEAELKVNGRELVKTNVGTFSTIATQLRFPRNSSIDDYRIEIYFSDDERHVPVLFTARHDAGDIRAELAGSELPGGTPAAADTVPPEVAASSTQVQPAPNPNTTTTTTPNAIPGGVPGIPGNPNPASPSMPSPSTPNRNPQGIPASPNTATPNMASPNTTSPNNSRPNPTTQPNLLNTTPNRTPGTTAAPATPTTLPPGLPFPAGEQLNFNIYLENVAQPVGQASFQVRARSNYFGRDGLLLTGNAKTTGAAQNIFSANDEMSSYVDPTTLLPFRSEMKLQESKRRMSQTVTLDQDRGNATTETGTRMEVPVGTYDLLSVFYALRSFNLKSSKPNAVSLLVNNRPRTLIITFLKRETIELGGQQIPALQLSLMTDDPQGDRNTLRLWVSEDQRRLPLRITAITTAGHVRADLAIIPIVRQ